MMLYYTRFRGISQGNMRRFLQVMAILCANLQGVERIMCVYPALKAGWIGRYKIIF